MKKYLLGSVQSLGTHFEYEPLDTAEFHIRLIDLHPEDRHGLVSCNVITTALSKSPPFYALSYVWGKERKVKAAIRCNGKILSITRSLGTALKHLRHADKNKDGFVFTSRYFWIDQICINQADTKERGHQVQQMRQIYATAIRTVIWHGDDDSFVTDAFELCDRVYDVARREYPEADEPSGIPTCWSKAECIANVKRAGLPPIDWTRRPWKKLGQFLAMPWVSRIWVIQECASSSTDPIVVVKRSMYSWQKMYWTATWSHNRGPPFSGSDRYTQRAIMNIYSIGGFAAAKSPYSLKYCLFRGAGLFDASDPRDRIYAVLGMSSDTRSNNEWPAALMPDYDKPVSKLYREVAKYLMLGDQNLSLLSYFVAFGENDGVEVQASWVPAFAMEYDEWDAAKSDPFTTTSSLLLQMNEPASLKFPHDDVLQQSGVSIGVIRCVSSQILYTRNCVEAWVDVVKSATNMAPEAATRAFVAAHSSSRSSDTTVEDFCAFLQSRNEFKDARRTSSLRRHVDWVDQTAREGNGDRYVNGSMGITNRRFFVTNNGFIGIGPPRLMKNTVLCALNNDRVLQALRPIGSHYTYVGDCWVEKLAGGKVQEMFDAGDLERQVFLIK